MGVLSSISIPIYVQYRKTTAEEMIKADLATAQKAWRTFTAGSSNFHYSFDGTPAHFGSIGILSILLSPRYKAMIEDSRTPTDTAVKDKLKKLGVKCGAAVDKFNDKQPAFFGFQGAHPDLTGMNTNRLCGSGSTNFRWRVGLHDSNCKIRGGNFKMGAFSRVSAGEHQGWSITDQGVYEKGETKQGLGGANSASDIQAMADGYACKTDTPS